jgi:hypothetical protein
LMVFPTAAVAAEETVLDFTELSTRSCHSRLCARGQERVRAVRITPKTNTTELPPPVEPDDTPTPADERHRSHRRRQPRPPAPRGPGERGTDR